MIENEITKKLLADGLIREYKGILQCKEWDLEGGTVMVIIEFLVSEKLKLKRLVKFLQQPFYSCRSNGKNNKHGKYGKWGNCHCLSKVGKPLHDVDFRRTRNRVH